MAFLTDNTAGTARIAGTVRHSSVDGPGVRYVVFFQGCPHHCAGCQNPETWNPAGGEEVSLEDLKEELRSTRYLDGVTLSGGDPFLQPEAAMAVADTGRDMGLNVWAYTGWTFEELLDGAAGHWSFSAILTSWWTDLSDRNCYQRNAFTAAAVTSA